MLRAAIVVGIVVKSFPGGKILRILRARYGCGIARLERIAGQGVKLIVLFAAGN